MRPQFPAIFCPVRNFILGVYDGRLQHPRKSDFTEENRLFLQRVRYFHLCSMVSANSLLIQHVRKFLLYLYCPQILFYYKLSAGIIQHKDVSDSSIFNKSANSLLFYIVRKFSFILNCPQVLSNKYIYPTPLYSIRPQIPSYCISSANSATLILYCPHFFF